MMGKVLAIAEEQSQKEGRTEQPRTVSVHCELPKTKYLFRGTDAWGKKVWFYKMQITGLEDRIMGPFDSRSVAIKSFDHILDAAKEAFCDALWCGNARESRAVP